MTTFYLIRHADKAVTGHVLTGRRPGVHLSEGGRDEAQALARDFADTPIDRILCSPRERTQETARPLADKKQLPIEICEDIDEIDFGDWTGKTVEQLEPDVYWQRYHIFRSGLAIPGGERVLDVQGRFVGAMLRLAQAHPDGRLALFSHGDPIRVAIAYFAGIPLELYGRLEISPASISVIRFDSFGPQILCLNARGVNR